MTVPDGTMAGMDSSFDAIARRWPDDPYVRFGVDPASVVRACSDEESAAWLFMSEFGPQGLLPRIQGFGGATSTALMLRLLEEVQGPTGITVDRRFEDQFPRSPGASWSRWDWWFTREAPDPHVWHAPTDSSIRLEELACDDPRINPFLDVASPHSFARPAFPEIKTWFALASGQDLLATCAVSDSAPGIPHLGGVATHPDHRNRGLARALCGEVTWLLIHAGHEAVTLGMMSTNAPARRVYGSLGFTVGREWSSCLLDGSRSRRRPSR